MRLGMWMMQRCAAHRGLSSPPAHMPMHGLVRLRTVLFPYGMVAVSMLAFGGPQSFAIRIGPIPVVVTAMLAAAIMRCVTSELPSKRVDTGIGLHAELS